MKSAKKLIIILLCFTAILAFSTCTYAKPSKKKVRNAYKTYVSKHLSSKHSGDFIKVKYIDINSDGTEEMFYVYEAFGTHGAVEVYTYKKGKVINCLSNEQYLIGVSYNKKQKRIVSSYGHTGRSYISVYKLAGTRLKCIKQFAYEVNPMNYKVEKIALNNKNITKAQYDAKTKKYIQSSKKYGEWKFLSY